MPTAAAAKAQADRAEAEVRPVAAVIPRAVRVAVIPQPLPVTPQRPRLTRHPLQRALIMHTTRLTFREQKWAIRRFTLELSGFSNSHRVLVTQRSIEK